MLFLVREHVLEVAVVDTIEYPDVEYLYLIANALGIEYFGYQSLLRETIYERRVVACSLD